MAAAVATPGLSDLLAWPTDHLTEAASHWEAAGDRSYGVAHRVWSDALNVDWQGEAAKTLRADTHADLMTTSAVVDQLQEAAGVARSGAADLSAARSALRYAVEDTRAAGFEVSEDLSVTDRSSGGSAAQRAARQAAARAFAGTIGERAAQLAATDAQVASRVTTAMAGIKDKFPKAPPTNGQIHAVDRHTFKQGPGPPPPPPPKGPSAGDVRKVLEKLPSNKSKQWIKMVQTPEDLQRLKQWMTEHGTHMPSRYPEGKGQWQRLPDGSEVGERYSADSTGKSALEIDLKKPDETMDHFKIHINPQQGGVLDIPPVEPAPAEAAPAESAPTESGPIEGFEGGGPVGIPSAPHFIHPPGTIDHGIPIIGEDDPGGSPRDFKH
jgi:hypothetical protein